jgi:hypothetical protein
MNKNNNFCICYEIKFTICKYDYNKKKNEIINRNYKKVILKENLLNISIERNKLIKKSYDMKIITEQEKEKNKELIKLLEDLKQNNKEQCIEILKNEKLIVELNSKILDLNINKIFN